MTTDLEELRKLAEKAVAVKPLEWREDGRTFGPVSYAIERIGDIFYVRSSEATGLFSTIEYADTLDEAKALAQADCAKRASNTIDLSPILALVSELEALRPALEMARGVISDMVECGIIGNAYYVGENVIPTIMGRPIPPAALTKNGS